MLQSRNFDQWARQNLSRILSLSLLHFSAKLRAPQLAWRRAAPVLRFEPALFRAMSGTKDAMRDRACSNTPNVLIIQTQEAP
jgi:hypothetical protein